MPLPPATASGLEQRLDEAAERRLGGVPADLPRRSWDVAAIPTEYLPVLAWALATDAWLPGATVAERRGAVAGAIEAHRQGGTERGVRRILDGAGALYDYTEPAPWRARIVIHNAAALAVSRALLEHVEERVKRASVHTTWVYQSGMSLPLPLAAGVGLRRSRTLLLYLEAPT